MTASTCASYINVACITAWSTCIILNLLSNKSGQTRTGKEKIKVHCCSIYKGTCCIKTPWDLHLSVI